MGDYFFGLHNGHLRAKADAIAKRHGAYHVNYTEPNGRERGWFGCPNMGAPHDQRIAAAVMADIDQVGGTDALRKKGS